MHKLRSDILSAGRERPSPVATKAKAATLGGSLASVPVKRTESRTTNQREGDRLPGVIATTTLTYGRHKHDARVVNLSSDGAMVELDLDVRIGDRVGISLGDGSDGKCIVRWIREGRIGLEFDGYSLELGQADDGSFAFRRNTSGKRRIAERAPRQSLVWRATIHAGHDSIPVRLVNVSSSGAMLEGDLAFEEGATVLLDLSGAGMMPSTIRWCEKGRAGVVFERDFDVGILSICAAADDGPRKVDWVKPAYLQDERDPNSPHNDWSRLSLADLSYFR